MALLTDEDLMPWWLAAGLDHDPSDSGLLPEIPDWLREDLPPLEPVGCSCECGGDGPAPAAVVEEPVRWAVPGVWDEPRAPVTVGGAVGQLQDAVGRLDAVDPSLLSPEQALAEAEALLAVEQRLRVLQLARTRDVDERRLFRSAGFRSTAAWLRTVAPDADSTDRTLARRLPALPSLSEAIEAGRVSITAGKKVGSAMGKVRLYLDRPDGLIDGLDGEETVAAMVTNVIDQVCRDRFGLSSTDPAQAALLAELEQATAAILAGGGTQQARVEAAMVLLAQYLAPASLADGLEDLVLTVVPSLLEQREKTGQDKRVLGLDRNADGTWHLEATLTAEAGEQLHTALAAEARRDPANPVDTALRAEERGGDPFDHTLAPWERNAVGDHDLELVPRTPSKRLHDAFGRLLTRYLAQGLGGTHSKVPVQLTAIVNERTLRGAPGAPPGRAASGRPLARSLLRRWWCDAHVTTLLMSHGWKPLGVVHSARTLTGTEMQAVLAQFDNRCAGDGCCPGTPDPLIPLVPHHVIGHAVAGRTSIDETVLACPNLHNDLHLGKKTIRLRDGRLLHETGWIDPDEPRPDPHAPF